MNIIKMNMEHKNKGEWLCMSNIRKALIMLIQ
jgi:hypothetical protein